MSHVTYIVTDPLTVKVYLKPQIQALLDNNWQVSVICGGDKAQVPAAQDIYGVSLHHIAMRREIDPFGDCIALVRFFFLLLRLRPTIVNAGTPKAGLLGMLASRLARIPVRIYQLHGLRLETATGWRRSLLLITERSACACSHKVLCVSRSLKNKAVELKLCRPEKVTVLGSGSCVGINLDDFTPTPEHVADAASLKAGLGIPTENPVIGFIGRLTKDKGIADLWGAYAIVKQEVPGAYMLLVGPFEDEDALPAQIRQQLEQSEFVRHVQWADNPRPYLHLMDVLALPTYREGLPGVLLEAAAAHTPIVATSATGVVDVVVNGETGLISPAGDAHALAQNIVQVLRNPGFAKELSSRARNKVDAEFSRDQVLRQLESFYTRSALECGIGSRKMGAPLQESGD